MVTRTSRTTLPERPVVVFTARLLSEESRLGRNTNEVPYAFGRLVKAGIEVWCYRDRRRISLDTPIEKFMVTATSFAADMERWLAQQRSVETMLRKARAGHVTGGRVFGYAIRPLVPIRPGKRLESAQENSTNSLNRLNGAAESLKASGARFLKEPPALVAWRIDS